MVNGEPPLRKANPGRILRHGKEKKDDLMRAGRHSHTPASLRSHTSDARQRSQQKHLSVIMNEATMSMSGRSTFARDATRRGRTNRARAGLTRIKGLRHVSD